MEQITRQQPGGNTAVRELFLSADDSENIPERMLDIEEERGEAETNEPANENNEPSGD